MSGVGDGTGDRGRHPRHGLDPMIHSAVRLSIVACLAAAERAEFRFVRDAVEVTASVLSKQVSALEEAGYVRVRKDHVGKFPRTWLSLSPAGRRAFEAHLAALAAIASRAGAGDVEKEDPCRPTAAAS